MIKKLKHLHKKFKKDKVYVKILVIVSSSGLIITMFLPFVL